MEGAGAGEEIMDPLKCLNINIGILGHVDSGKTSLGSFVDSRLDDPSSRKDFC